MFWADTSSDPSAAPHQAHDLPEVHAAEPAVPHEAGRVAADEAGRVAPGEAGQVAPGEVQAAEPAAPHEVDQVAADEEFLSAMAAEFDAIQSALVRLDEGTFDTCQVCGGSIGLDRLMADPLLSRCPAHS